ncbi:MAG: molybdopterin dinucleotide binding domain-containing protein [Candidatus Binatia bacterium]
MEEHFFDGHIDAALNFQLAPAGLTARRLRESPGGLRADSETRYQKYAEVDPVKSKSRGFDTLTRKIEIFSATFAETGYAPLPQFSADTAKDEQYPLTLTFFRDIHFCDEQHRNIPRLRRAVPEPFLEIHPSAAQEKCIADGAWVWLETATGKVKLKAKFTDSLHPKVVMTVYGWWQPCEELKLGGYGPFHPDGANTNLLIPNTDNDPISASVAHRGQRCRVTTVVSPKFEN